MVYLHFVCFYLQPSKTLEITLWGIDSFLEILSKTWERTLRSWTRIVLSLKLFSRYVCAMLNVNHVHPCHSSPAVRAYCKAWPNSISCHLEAFCISMRALPTLMCDLISRCACEFVQVTFEKHVEEQLAAKTKVRNSSREPVRLLSFPLFLSQPPK